MGYVGRTTIDEFEWVGFKHEAQELLVRFRFICFPSSRGWKILKTPVTKDQSIVDIADVFDEEVVVGEDGFEVDGPNLFADGNHHEA